MSVQHTENRLGLSEEEEEEAAKSAPVPDGHATVLRGRAMPVSRLAASVVGGSPGTVSSPQTFRASIFHPVPARATWHVVYRTSGNQM